MFSQFSLPKKNYVLSSSSGAYTNSTTSLTAVCSATIVTGGNPVKVKMIGDNAGGSDILLFANTAFNNQIAGGISIFRGATNIETFGPILVINPSTALLQLKIPTNAVEAYDPVAAGTYTYTLKALVTSTNYQINMTNICLLLVED